MRIDATSGITPNGALSDIVIEIERNEIFKVSNESGNLSDFALEGILIPSFIDLHCHGGGGYYFSDKKPENVEQAIGLHRSHGTSMQILSLVSQSLDDLAQQISQIAPLYQDNRIAGIHLEGPYLSSEKAGAHDPSLLRAPKVSELEALLSLGGGAISMVTIAPELVGALDAIKYLAESGVVVALGHTNADVPTFAAAIEAGAKLITHFNNAMRKLGSDDSSVADFILNQSDIEIEIILDRVHISDEIAREIFRRASNRVILITDAMSAAGSLDGNYQIGNLDVCVEDSIARLTTSGALAGSTLTMDRAFLNAIELGMTVEDAVMASSTRAAQMFGFDKYGSIAPGKRADLLLYSPTHNSIERVVTN